jgi:hypothetical protein
MADQETIEEVDTETEGYVYEPKTDEELDELAELILDNKVVGSWDFDDVETEGEMLAKLAFLFQPIMEMLEAKDIEPLQDMINAGVEVFYGYTDDFRVEPRENSTLPRLYFDEINVLNGEDTEKLAAKIKAREIAGEKPELIIPGK